MEEDDAVNIDLTGINWLTVIAATVIYFALGAVWFAPQTPLGRAWMKAGGYRSPTEGARSSSAFYMIPAFTAFVIVSATALIARATGTDALSEGIVLGLVAGIGYAAMVVLTTAAFEFSKPQRWTWGVIDASYHAIGILIAAVIIAVWQ